MLYRKYFDDNQTQREFFDSIAGQCSTRTMSADDHGLFVEYETRDNPRPYHLKPGERVVTIWVPNPGNSYELILSDSGQLTSFALPLAVAAIAMYLMHFMAAHGIFAAFSVLGGR